MTAKEAREKTKINYENNCTAQSAKVRAEIKAAVACGNFQIRVDYYLYPEVVKELRKDGYGVVETDYSKISWN